MSSMEDMELELKGEFLEEARALLQGTEQAFLDLEGDINNSELLDEIFRLSHNIKGTAMAVGLNLMANLTHEMESIILQVKEGKLKLSSDIVSVFLECNDSLNDMINSLSQDITNEVIDENLYKRLKLINSGKDKESQKGDGPKVLGEKEPSPDEREIRVEENVSAKYEQVGPDELKSGPMFHRGQIEEPALVQTNQDPAPPTAPVSGKKIASEVKIQDEVIRISLPQVEKLNNYVGELVILQTMLNERVSTKIHDEVMAKSLAQLDKLSKEIQAISMDLRMLPIKQTMQKMKRIVRDTSFALKKSVKLELTGQETKVDKTVLDLLADPLVHIVRNAVDHGLEMPEERENAGKSKEGIVRIHSFHEGNYLVIVIEDDGKGIDAQKIKKIAIEKKILSEEIHLEDDDIIQLIFHPGFSTKSQVSEISGRGVGMDVVKKNIEKLSGKIQVSTVLGKGTIFRITLPLTLAVIDGIVVSVEGQKYIIPITQVHEFLAPSEENIHNVSGVGPCLNLRDKILPLFQLSESLLQAPVKERKFQRKVISSQIAIIVKQSQYNFSLLVDDVLHQQQVVIKKLGEEIPDQVGFMGSSILGDGKPAIILDLIELFSQKIGKTQNKLLKMAFEEESLWVK